MKRFFGWRLRMTMRYNLLEGGEINSEMQTPITPTLPLPRQRGRE